MEVEFQYTSSSFDFSTPCPVPESLVLCDGISFPVILTTRTHFKDSFSPNAVCALTGQFLMSHSIQVMKECPMGTHRHSPSITYWVPPYTYAHWPRGGLDHIKVVVLQPPYYGGCSTGGGGGTAATGTAKC